MNTPFVRPFFATFFYVLAGLSAFFAVLMAIGVVAGGISFFGRGFAAWVAVYGVLVLISMLISSGF